MWKYEMCGRPGDQVTVYLVGFLGSLSRVLQGGSVLMWSSQGQSTLTCMFSSDPYHTLPISIPSFGDEETEAQMIFPKPHSW